MALRECWSLAYRYSNSWNDALSRSKPENLFRTIWGKLCVEYLKKKLIWDPRVRFCEIGFISWRCLLWKDITINISDREMRVPCFESYENGSSEEDGSMLRHIITKRQERDKWRIGIRRSDGVPIFVMWMLAFYRLHYQILSKIKRMTSLSYKKTESTSAKLTSLLNRSLWLSSFCALNHILQLPQHSSMI